MTDNDIFIGLIALFERRAFERDVVETLEHLEFFLTRTERKTYLFQHRYLTVNGEIGFFPNRMVAEIFMDLSKTIYREWKKHIKNNSDYTWQTGMGAGINDSKKIFISFDSNFVFGTKIGIRYNK